MSRGAKARVDSIHTPSAIASAQLDSGYSSLTPRHIDGDIATGDNLLALDAEAGAFYDTRNAAGRS